jgi:hypothetical protein
MGVTQIKYMYVYAVIFTTIRKKKYNGPTKRKICLSSKRFEPFVC